MNLPKSFLSAWMCLVPLLSNAQDWQMQPAPLTTRWASTVDPNDVWSEYPRPQMVRPEWKNLNGLWDYAITQKGDLSPRRFPGKILVPFPVESALSGVKKSLQPDQLLWYRRTIQVSSMPVGERVLLHFGAVDYEATVFVNEKKLGTHSGGYQSFELDITEALRPGENELIVKVFDPTNTGPNPSGKQHLNAHWAFYTPSSGIWQTVWLEHVPATYIRAVNVTPDVDRAEVKLDVALSGSAEEYTIEAVARNDGKVVARREIHGATTTTIAIARPRLWSPDDPHLYDLQVRLLRGGEQIDAITSYFGFRKIEVRKDVNGHARIFLNNRSTYNLAVVDQGFWPDGLYTAPSDAALKFDVQAAKALGFNTIRKHIKIEPQRWYYHCDKLGLMVWQDMPSGNNDSADGRAEFEREIEDNLSQLHNHPSVTMWVLFNEGWGAYDQERLARKIQRADPSRILNGHSGPWDQLRLSQYLKLMEPWYQLKEMGSPISPEQHIAQSESLKNEIQSLKNGSVGDVVDIHVYPGPEMYPASANVASVTGEHGSFGVYIEGHVWNELGRLGLGVGATGLTPEQMLQAYARSTTQLQTLAARGLSGSGYFETFDVETEQQGFITYDRAIAKVPVERIARLNARLVPRAKNYTKAVQGFSVELADQLPESERYAKLLVEFERGRRDLPFLRRFGLMALRQGDQARVTEAADAYVSIAPQPFSAEAWEVMIALTNTSKGKTFELLRARADSAAAAVGAQQAERKLQEVIVRERVLPYFKQAMRPQHWSQFEEAMAAEYGELGREAVYGAWMMDAFAREDWSTFGDLYGRYFATAMSRSAYSVHSLSYYVLTHVNDTNALEVAARVMQWRIDTPRESPTLGRYDAVELDTYANLLHKLGRVPEALEWQRRAVAESFGRDQDIVANLEKMQRTSAQEN